MKVLFLVAHLQSGGAERTVSYLSSFLAQNGVDVSILSLTDDIFYSVDDKVKLVTLSIPSSSNNFVDKLSKAAKRYYGINRYLSNNPQDIVFCMLPDMAKYIINVSRKRKFKLVTSERNNPGMSGNEELKTLIFRESDGVIFQTERAMRWYPEEIQSKGVVIHNAVGNELVYEVGEVAEREKKISAVGRLSAQKDYPTLFKAFKIVLQKHPDYRLEIFGTGPDEQKLRDLTYELGISENVIFMGVHRDAVLQIANSSCYVMSSVFEGMPNALMEAMAIGLPCVSTDCPNGPAELIENEVSGLLVPVGDSEAIATAICRMIEDKTFAADCGKNAKKILDTHSIEIIAKKYLDYIQSVVEKR